MHWGESRDAGNGAPRTRSLNPIPGEGPNFKQGSAPGLPERPAPGYQKSVKPDNLADFARALGEVLQEASHKPLHKLVSACNGRDGVSVPVTIEGQVKTAFIRLYPNAPYSETNSKRHLALSLALDSRSNELTCVNLEGLEFEFRPLGPSPEELGLTFRRIDKPTTPEIYLCKDPTRVEFSGVKIGRNDRLEPNGFLDVRKEWLTLAAVRKAYEAQKIALNARYEGPEVGGRRPPNARFVDIASLNKFVVLGSSQLSNGEITVGVQGILLDLEAPDGQKRLLPATKLPGIKLAYMGTCSENPEGSRIEVISSGTLQERRGVPSLKFTLPERISLRECDRRVLTLDHIQVILPPFPEGITPNDICEFKR